MTYAPDIYYIGYRGAWYVDRILKGARPEQLPVGDADSDSNWSSFENVASTRPDDSARDTYFGRQSVLIVLKVVRSVRRLYEPCGECSI